MTDEKEMDHETGGFVPRCLHGNSSDSMGTGK